MPRDNLLFGVGLFPNGLLNNAPPNNNNNNANGPTLLNNNNPNYVNGNHLAAFRDRMFHAIFHRMAIAYARTFPKPVRRILEWVFLLKALAVFLMLLYIHVIFSRTPITCLDHIKDTWPREGILRIDIMRGSRVRNNTNQPYSLLQSYAKERQIHQREEYEYQAVLGIFGVESFSAPNVAGEEAPGAAEPQEQQQHAHEESTRNDTLISNLTLAEAASPEPSPLPLDVNEIDKIMRAVWPEEEYIVEFSLEYGFLRLSPATRRKLNISIMLVTLDPDNNTCFGDGFSRFLLDEFLGYNDFIMGAVKALAEAEDSQGYLRNVVTDTVHINAVALLEEPDLHLHRGFTADARVQRQRHVPGRLVLHRHLGFSWNGGDHGRILQRQFDRFLRHHLCLGSRPVRRRLLPHCHHETTLAQVLLLVSLRLLRLPLPF